MGRLTGYERRQAAVYWGKTAEDEYNKPIVSSPVELRVRWVDKEAENLDANGNVIRTDVELVVDRELALGSVLWKGKLKNLPSPFNHPLYQVVITRTIPDLKNKESRYRVFLTRYSTTLPTVE